MQSQMRILQAAGQGAFRGAGKMQTLGGKGKSGWKMARLAAKPRKINHLKGALQRQSVPCEGTAMPFISLHAKQRRLSSGISHDTATHSGNLSAES
jgi:hypothetical protein